jgi:hypothetical protein
VSKLSDIIRSADDRASEIIDVEEWGVKLEVRSMTGQQRSDMQQAWSQHEEQSASFLFSEIIKNCVFDPDSGESVFAESDLEWLLAEKSASVIDSVAQVCLQISGLGSDSVDDAGKDSLTLVEGIQS